VPRDRNKPQTQVSFRYGPLGRRISKTRQQTLGGRPAGTQVTTRDMTPDEFNNLFNSLPWEYGGKI
ncbi:hypothetical protein SAMN05216563_1361, partial [Phytobacter palmae]